MKIMIWNAARGGMRSVVEGYVADGFISQQNVKLIHSYADESFFSRQVTLARALVVCAWTMATKRVELLHCHSAMKGSFWRKSIFARMAAVFGIPVIFHLHGSEMKSFYERQKPFVRQVIKRELERADVVIVLSQSWHDFVSGIAPGASVAILPNYVTVPEATSSSSGGSGTLLFLGAVGVRKGVFDLLTAFAAALESDRTLRLLIGGNGEIEEARRRAEQLGVQDRVEFLGWVDSDARAKLLDEAAIYVLPSYNEGLPMSVLEAMSAGLATITTRVGGLPELIENGKTGVLIEPGDVSALTAAIHSLVQNPGKRRQIGDAARKRIESSYSRDIVLKKLETIYEATGRAATVRH